MLRIGFSVSLWLLAFHGYHGYLLFSDVREILKEKVSVGSMHTDIRPQNDQSSPSWGSWMFFLIQDFEIHDIENKLEVNTLFTYGWYDDTISWNTSLFSAKTVEMKRFSVWNPTIVMRNTIGKKSYLGNFSHVFWMTIDWTGFVQIFGQHLFKTHCEVDMTYFPFDTQECSFEITSWPSEFRFADGKCIMQNTNSEWTNVEVNYTLSETSLVCTVKANRKPTFLIINLIVPTVLIGLLNVFVFIVPSNAGEKLQYSVSILLSFNVYIGILVDSVPANSEKMSILSYYIIYQYIFGVVVITVTTILLRTVTGNNCKDIPPKCLTVVTIVDLITCKINCLCGSVRVRDSEDNCGGNASSQSNIVNKVTWVSVCAAFDFLLFWLFLLVQVIGNLAFFLSLKRMKLEAY